MLSDLIYFFIGMIIYLRYQMALKTILRAFLALKKLISVLLKNVKHFDIKLYCDKITSMNFPS
nr:MAG TPA: hypothetical protein [Caudoviricetes sp.]